MQHKGSDKEGCRRVESRTCERRERHSTTTSEQGKNYRGGTRLEEVGVLNACECTV